MFIQRIGGIGRTYRHIQRYTEILGVFFKFGFGDLVNSLKVEQYVDLGRKVIFRERRERIESLTRAERLRLVLEELGPTFIKLGQMLSTRTDLLPADFIKELTKLQDKAPLFPFEEVLRILDGELEDDREHIFNYIDPIPLAAASIAQVHKAALTSGEKVVIKVQRPRIKATIEVDIEIMMHLAELVERRLEGWEIHQPSKLVEEFRRTIQRELDFNIEAGNIERLGAMYKNDDRAYVPAVYRRLTTHRVLTMEYVTGIHAGNLDALRLAGYDLTAIADVGAELVIEQTLHYGYFHADPHPGNILIMPGQVICFLDMGMMGRIDRPTRELIVDLALGVVRQDPSAMTKALLKLTDWDREPDQKEMGRDLINFVDQYFNRPIKEIQLAQMLQHVFDISSKYRMRLPADLLLLIKALSTIEGQARLLNPDFDVVSKAAPFVRRIRLGRYKPGRVALDAWDYVSELATLVRDVPDELRTVLRMGRQGRLKLHLEHEGLETLRVTWERAANRLSFSLVLASLIIGSSLVVQTNIPPTWNGIPIIGVVGYLVAGAMGFWLLITIIRRGMM